MNSPNIGNKTSRKIERNTVVGLGLAVVGILFSEYSFFILSNTAMTAVGLSSLILGVVTLMIPGNSISRSYVSSIVNESYVNIEEILKQFDAKERCIFIPPRNGRVFVYVPIGTPSIKERNSQAWKVMDAPIRILTTVDGKPGLIVFLPLPYEILTTVEDGSKPEEALNYILIEQLEILESVKAVESMNKISVHMSGFSMDNKFTRIQMVLGSLPTSMTGCILSLVLKKPLVLIKEEFSKESITSTYEVLNK